jgi:hypothetical protein
MQAFDECFDQTFALSSLSLLSLMQAFDERFDQTFKLADKKVCVCVCVCVSVPYVRRKARCRWMRACSMPMS